MDIQILVVGYGPSKTETKRIKSRTARVLVRALKFKERLHSIPILRPLSKVVGCPITRLQKRWEKEVGACSHKDISSVKETGWSSLCWDCGRWSS